MDAPIKPLDSNQSFLLNIEGQKALALKLPNGVAKDITGQSTSSGILAKIKSVFGRGSSDQWLILTNTQNPLLQDQDHFRALVAQGLTTVVGTQVPVTNMVISGSTPIPRIQQQTPNRVGR